MPSIQFSANFSFIVADLVDLKFFSLFDIFGYFPTLLCWAFREKSQCWSKSAFSC